jgi:hypothetical protein
MKRFAAMEALMEKMDQHALERQLDLLLPVEGDATTRLFDTATRAEVVSLLKALLSDRLAAVRALEETDDE